MPKLSIPRDSDETVRDVIGEDADITKSVYTPREHVVHYDPSGEDPEGEDDVFECEEEDCDRVFDSKRGRASHMRVHN